MQLLSHTDGCAAVCAEQLPTVGPCVAMAPPTCQGNTAIKGSSNNKYSIWKADTTRAPDTALEPGSSSDEQIYQDTGCDHPEARSQLV